jgi:hypothetical protein
LPWKKTSECVFRIFSKFELENFGEYVPKFLYKDKNRKMGGRKETRGVGREKYRNEWICDTILATATLAPYFAIPILPSS